MEWFTSDTHYGHRNIVTYCDRPFTAVDGQPDVEMMNRTMIERWNDRVGPQDTVFHLGDFSLEKHVSRLLEYRKKLNGRIVLVRGNHDQSTQKMLQAGFDEVHNQLEIEREGLKLYLQHIPVFAAGPEARELRAGQKHREYDRKLVKTPPAFFHYFLCGHVHEKWLRRGNVINVGVDQWDFRPVTLAELMAAPNGT